MIVAVNTAEGFRHRLCIFCQLLPVHKPLVPTAFIIVNTEFLVFVVF